VLKELKELKVGQVLVENKENFWELKVLWAHKELKEVLVLKEVFKVTMVLLVLKEHKELLVLKVV
jgi:hypothetical protein